MAFWGSDPGSPESSAALDKYTAGDTVDLSFEEDPQGQCLIDLIVSADIEIPCPREITFTKEAASTEP